MGQAWCAELFQLSTWNLLENRWSLTDQPWPPSNCLGCFPIVRKVLLLQLANFILLYWMCRILPSRGASLQCSTFQLLYKYHLNISIYLNIIYIIYILNRKNSEDPMCTTGPLPDTHDSSRITSPHMSMILSVSNKNDLRQNCVMTTCFWTIINVTKWYLPIEAWNKRKEDPLKIIQCTLPFDTVVGKRNN